MKTAKKILIIIVSVTIFGFFPTVEAKQLKKTANAKFSNTSQPVTKKKTAVSIKKSKKKKMHVRKKAKQVKKRANQSIKIRKEKREKTKKVQTSQQMIVQNRVDTGNDTAAINPMKKLKFQKKSRVLTRHVSLATTNLKKLRARNDSLSRTRVVLGRLSHTIGRIGTDGQDLLDDPRIDPRLEWIKHQVNRQMEMDRWLNSPERDKIDQSTPGMPGPDREPPCHDTGELADWYQNNMVSDLQYHRDPGGYSKWTRGYPEAMRSKIEGLVNDSHVAVEECGNMEDDSSEDSGEGNSSTDDDAEEEGTEVEASEEVVEEDPEDTQDANRDSDPEGDDPDESYSPVSVTAVEVSEMINAEAMMGNNDSNNDHSQNGNGKPVVERSVDEGGEGNGGGLGELGKAHTTGSPIPEDGQPDELTSPTASGAIGHALAGGYNYQPEPGGGDPNDPRANESMGGIMGTIGNAMAGGYNSQPGPDGEDPDDPRANEGMVKP